MQNNQQYFYSPLRFKEALNLASTPNILKNIGKGIRKDDIQQKIQLRISQILSLKKQGKMTAALQKVTVLSSQNAQNLRLFQIKGQILFTMRRFQDALNCYEYLINKTEASQNWQMNEGEKVKLISLSLYYFNYSLCLQKLRRYKEAIKFLKQAQSKNPNKLQIQVSLAENYQSLGYKDQVVDQILKIRQKAYSNTIILKKCLQLLTKSDEYQNIIELIEGYFRENQHKDINEQISLYLLQSKADCLRKLERFKQAVQTYEDILSISPNKQQRIYENLAYCLQRLSPQRSINVYRQMLLLYPQHIKAANNLANLLIRTKQFDSAIEVLDKVFKTADIESLDYHKLTLLKCHKSLALINLQKKKQAYSILKQIIQLVSEKNHEKEYSKSQRENINFVEALVQKYSNSISKVCEIESMNEVPDEISKQAERLSLQLIGSISLQLQSKVGTTQKGQDQLQRLSQRINHLYQEILKFKKTTLKDHQVSQLKVHNKIQQLQQILEKKEEQANKLTVDMSVLKKQYSDIYRFIQTANQQQTQGVLMKAITNLASENKDIVTAYSKQFYWIFSAYLVSIRLVANDLVPSGKNIAHLSKVGSFFARFKGVFQTVTRVPYIGTVCSAINSLLTLYLSEQSKMVYQTLNKTVTSKFIRQQSMQESLQKGICSLVSSQYIGKAFEKLKTKKIISDISLKNKANEWFQKQKSKLIKKIINFSQGKQALQDILIKELIIQDIGAILLYIIKNGDKLLKSQTQSNFFTFIFEQVLISDFKSNEITEVYIRNQQKQVLKDRNYESTCSNNCKIY